MEKVKILENGYMLKIIVKLLEIYQEREMWRKLQCRIGINLTNLDLYKTYTKILKKIIKLGKKVKIKFVKDRPGHDIRYALNSKKIKKIKWKHTK